MTTNQPIAKEAYDQLADSFAAEAPTKPHNAHYDRPAVLGLLGEVNGQDVFDAGCGPGIYADELLARGARVTGCDVSDRMVALAQQRLGDRARIFQADLGLPLPQVSNASCDAVVCPLVLDYVRDWAVPLGEFFRVLRPGGRLVFSCEHPFARVLHQKPEYYFDTALDHVVWRGFSGAKVRMPSWRRPLGQMVAPLLAAGFVLEQLHEPLPTPAFKEADPRHYAELSRMPGFIAFRCRKPQ